MKLTEDDLPAATSGTADGSGQVLFSSKKGEPAGLPFSIVRIQTLRSGPASRRALNLSSVKAPGAHLDLRDLAIDEDARNLKVGLERPTRPVVRVRDVVPVRDSLVANVAAVSLDLRHG
jgi:hypothetical protein